MLNLEKVTAISVDGQKVLCYMGINRYFIMQEENGYLLKEERRTGDVDTYTMSGLDTAFAFIEKEEENDD